VGKGFAAGAQKIPDMLSLERAAMEGLYFKLNITYKYKKELFKYT
jgi:hypothetical protein